MRTVQERIQAKENYQRKLSERAQETNNALVALVDELKEFVLGDFGQKRLILNEEAVEVFFGHGIFEYEDRLKASIDQTLREIHHHTKTRKGDPERLELELMALIILLRLQRNGRKQYMKETEEEFNYKAEEAISSQISVRAAADVQEAEDLHIKAAFNDGRWEVNVQKLTPWRRVFLLLKENSGTSYSVLTISQATKVSRRRVREILVKMLSMKWIIRDGKMYRWSKYRQPKGT
jgi:hypothetical protein